VKHQHLSEVYFYDTARPEVNVKKLAT